MLELNPESVAQIAEKAREFQSEEILLPPEPPRAASLIGCCSMRNCVGGPSDASRA